MRGHSKKKKRKRKSLEGYVDRRYDSCRIVAFVIFRSPEEMPCSPSYSVGRRRPCFELFSALLSKLKPTLDVVKVRETDVEFPFQ